MGSELNNSTCDEQIKEPRCPYCNSFMWLSEQVECIRLKWVRSYYYNCKKCGARSPIVCTENLESARTAAKRMANSGFFDVGPVITNGDKLREFANMPDEVLAQRLLEIADIAEEIPFCKELPECQELAEGIEPITADKCLQCLINWLGQPTEEEA